MQIWQDEAIILSANKYAENLYICKVFSASHGIYSGVVKMNPRASYKDNIITGNVVNAIWSANTSRQLGKFKLELIKAIATKIFEDYKKLTALSSICLIIEASFPEREHNSELYNILKGFLDSLVYKSFSVIDYINIELRLLSIIGYGLDLQKCVATGNKEELVYVSPKSGKAVSKEAGDPYSDKLFTLPEFLLQDDKPATSKDCLDGLRLTRYFLQKHIFDNTDKKIPGCRVRLEQFFMES